MTLRRVAKVAVLGANGAMGSGCGEIFAADGIETAFLARDHEKAREGLERAQSMAKSDKIADFVQLGTYDRELDVAVAEADLVFEALAEDLPLKQEFFERVDRLRRPDSIVATARRAAVSELMTPPLDSMMCSGASMPRSISARRSRAR